MTYLLGSLWSRLRIAMHFGFYGPNILAEWDTISLFIAALFHCSEGEKLSNNIFSWNHEKFRKLKSTAFIHFFC